MKKRIFTIAAALILAIVGTIFILPAGTEPAASPVPPTSAAEWQSAPPQSDASSEAPAQSIAPPQSDASSESPAQSIAPPQSDASSESPAQSIAPPQSDAVSRTGVERGTYYYDLEHVILYLDTYGELPENYITKSEARKLGWTGGSVEPYRTGAAIGGDRFGNMEGLLPNGSYTECDLDTAGRSSRGAKRLIFSSSGRYFYTDDHYESFTEYIVSEGQVRKK